MKLSILNLLPIQLTPSRAENQGWLESRSSRLLSSLRSYPTAFFMFSLNRKLTSSTSVVERSVGEKKSHNSFSPHPTRPRNSFHPFQRPSSPVAISDSLSFHQHPNPTFTPCCEPDLSNTSHPLHASRALVNPKWVEPLLTTNFAPTSLQLTAFFLGVHLLVPVINAISHTGFPPLSLNLL